MKDHKAYIVESLKKLGDVVMVMEPDNPYARFKKVAYLKAAKTIANMKVPLVSANQVINMQGIGKSIYAKVEEMLKTGKLSKLNKFAGSDKDYSELMKVKGIGPVKAQKLFKEYKIKTLKELYALIQKKIIVDGKLERHVVREMKLKGRRMSRAEAIDLSNEIMFPLRLEVPKAMMIVCGSIRRNAATSGDIDIVMAGDKNTIAKGYSAVKKIGWEEVIEVGAKKFSAIYKGIGVDIRFVNKHQFGAMMMSLTGSYEFNIEMRRLAISKGMKLNEYGLFKGKWIAGLREEDIFKALGMGYIAPEFREAGFHDKK